MNLESQNAVVDGAEHSPKSHRALVVRLIICGAALFLLGSAAACASPPEADPLPAGEVIFAKMCSAIESVSRGIVHVEDYSSTDNHPSPLKSTYVLTFDDSKGMLRCDTDRRSRRTKYVRNPAESLFQLLTPPQGITVNLPDHKYSDSDDHPLEPHILWFAGAGGYRFRQPYSHIIRQWRQQAREATVSKDNRGRLLLRWTKRLQYDPANLIRTLIIDPAQGYVPVVNKVATMRTGLTESTINALSEIRYEKKNGHFVPVSLDMRENAVTIKVTCRWESVNEDIDPKVFTVEGFEPKKGTAIWDQKGPQPVLLRITGEAAPDGRGRQGPR
jgi:hypothetical protein